VLKIILFDKVSILSLSTLDTKPKIVSFLNGLKLLMLNTLLSLIRKFVITFSPKSVSGKKVNSNGFSIVLSVFLRSNAVDFRLFTEYCKGEYTKSLKTNS